MSRSDRCLFFVALAALGILVLSGYVLTVLDPTPDEYKEMIGVPLDRWCRFERKVIDCDRLCEVDGKWKVCK
jgi:hypothetical protein